VDFFQALGVRPVVGRTFVAGEDRAGGGRVAVLSDALWERRFHRDPAVLDRSVDIDGVAHRIVGVLGPHVEMRLVLARLVWLAAIGTALGLPLAWVLSGNLSAMLDNVSPAMLDNVSPTDVTVYAGVTLFLFAVLLIAAYLPARRAAHADPCETLKAC
jgi:MacB-like periplasmic core domain